MAKLTASADVSALLAAANYADFLTLLGLAPADVSFTSDTLVKRDNAGGIFGNYFSGGSIAVNIIYGLSGAPGFNEGWTTAAAVDMNLQPINNSKSLHLVPGALAGFATSDGNVAYANDLTAPVAGATAADGGTDLGLVMYNSGNWIVVAVL